MAQLQLADDIRGSVQDAFNKGLQEEVQDSRPHQVDAVTKILLAVSKDMESASAVNYLLQHSTGSGKSATIACLVSMLAGWRDQAGAEFHTVLVVNDRLQLDLQLSTCVVAFWEATGHDPALLQRANTTAELHAYLAAPPGSPGRPMVVLTTLQKLATLWRSRKGCSTASSNHQQAACSNEASSSHGMLRQQGRVAVIADEAHRHHGHGTTEQIHHMLSALGASGGLAGSNMGKRGRQQGIEGTQSLTGSLQPRWLTYIGLTATPSHHALMLFGVAATVHPDPLFGGFMSSDEDEEDEQALGSGSNGVDHMAVGHATGERSRELATLYAPFHVYSMEQAIRDGYVLDVLANYSAITPRLQIAGVHSKQAQARKAAGQHISAKDGASDSDRCKGKEDWEDGQAQAQEDGEVLAEEEALMEAASNSRDVVKRKAAYIAQHFLDRWERACACGGGADGNGGSSWPHSYSAIRAMVVARSREAVAWYTLELRELLAQSPRYQRLAKECGDPQFPSPVFGAFSGSVRVDESEYEHSMSLTSTPMAARSQIGADLEVRRTQESEEGALAERCNRSLAQDASSTGRHYEKAFRSRSAVDGMSKKRARGSKVMGSGTRLKPNPWDAALACLDSSRQKVAAAAATGTVSPMAGLLLDGDSGSADEGSDSGQSGNEDRSSGSDSEDGDGHAWSDKGRSAASSEDGAQQAHEDKNPLASSNGDDSGSDEDSANAGMTYEGGGTSAVEDEDEESQGREGLRQGTRYPLTRGSPRPRHSCSGSLGLFEGSPSPSVSRGQAGENKATADTCNADGELGVGSVLLQTPLFRSTDQLSRGSRLTRSVSRLSLASSMSQDITARAAHPQSPGFKEGLLGSSGTAATGDGGGGGGGDLGPDTTEPGKAAKLSSLIQVTESDMNGRGTGPEHARLLVCCSKYETGYNDPRLGIMYVDRAMSGARAVQTLGRLNRPAAQLGKDASQVAVVDFVNGAGTLREAFQEYYGATTLQTGRAAKRLRAERQLDWALTRMLELLQPAADHAALAAAAATTNATAQNDASLSSASLSSNGLSVDGALGDMGAREVAGLCARWLGPEARKALEADLAVYCNTCQTLKREKAEMPLVFALELQNQLGGAKAARERQQTAKTILLQEEQQQQQEEEEAGAAPAPALQVQVEVCELEETFAGPIWLASADSSAPLRSRPITTRLLSKGRGAKGSLARKVRQGRPLTEVIAAANAALEGRYEARQAAGLRELCLRLRQAETAASTAATASADLTAAAAARMLAANALGSVSKNALPGSGPAGTATADGKDGLPKHISSNVVDGQAGNGPAVNGTGSNVSSGDVYALLSLLRRLSLWPVTAALLKDTGAGRILAGLKKHTSPQVAYAACVVVKRWKAEVAAQAAEAAAAAARKQAKAARQANRHSVAAGAEGGSGATPPGRLGMQRNGSGGHEGVPFLKTPSGGAGVSAVVASVVGKGTRDRAQQRLADALSAQAKAAARSGAAAKDSVTALYNKDPARLQLLASELEQAVFAAHPGDVAYRKQMLTLFASFQHADGPAAELLVGSRRPEELAVADGAALQPASIRAQAEAVARRKEQDERAWEEFAASSGTGGVTYSTDKIRCPSCQCKRAVVHNVLSGGTYAQERVQIQKYVCSDCGYTWRND